MKRTLGRAAVNILVLVTIMVDCHGQRGQTPIDRSASARLICGMDPSRSRWPPHRTREECLKPPWNLDAAHLPPDLEELTCEPEDRGHRFTYRGSHTPSLQELLAFKQRHARELLALEGIASLGVGGCRCGPLDALCLQLTVDICTQSVGSIATTLARWWKDDARSDARLDFTVHLAGSTRPRCSGDPGRCLPISNRDDRSAERAGYRCDGPRHSEHDAPTGLGTCAHDGECEVSGCNDVCVPWTEAREATCALGNEARRSEGPIFCGCVEGTCRWFKQ